MALSARARSWLEMQGYDVTDGAALEEIAPWTRLAPALCMTGAAIGTVLASPWLLGALAVTAALGAAFPAHPFDLIYNLGIRRLIGARPLPPNAAPRRFSCGVATVWLSLTALLFALDATAAGYALGGLLVLVAGVLTATGFCIPSFIFRACQTRIAEPREAA